MIEQRLVTWQDPFGEVRAEVIGVVENRGGTHISIPGGTTGYSITTPTGRVVAGGRIAHVFPSVLEPGQRGYLIDALAATFVDRAELAGVSFDIHVAPAEPSPTALTVDDAKWAIEDAHVVVSGHVRNDGTAPAREVVVGAVLRNTSGEILCGVYDVGDIGDLGPGESAAFSTSYPAVQPEWPAEGVTVEVVAFTKSAD